MYKNLLTILFLLNISASASAAASDENTSTTKKTQRQQAVEALNLVDQQVSVSEPHFLAPLESVGSRTTPLRSSSAAVILENTYRLLCDRLNETINAKLVEGRLFSTDQEKQDFLNTNGSNCKEYGPINMSIEDRIREMLEILKILEKQEGMKYVRTGPNVDPEAKVGDLLQ